VVSAGRPIECFTGSHHHSRLADIRQQQANQKEVGHKNKAINIFGHDHLDSKTIRLFAHTRPWPNETTTFLCHATLS
jgi:hypothetical protein